jgi:1,4-dihydroxy-2-naphthoyl-CoA hydrolase
VQFLLVLSGRLRYPRALTRGASVSKPGSNDMVNRDPGVHADSGSGTPLSSPALAPAGQGAPGLVGVLGLEIVKVSAAEVLAEWTIDQRHLQPHGVVHGGVYCSVVETCCSLGAQEASAGTPVVGVDNHTSFVRAAREGRLTARATPLHIGRRAQLWECVILDASQRLIATGRLRLMTASGSTSEREGS